MLRYAVPPGYRRQQRIKRPKLGPWLGVIDATMDDEKQRPAKQRHTDKRVFERLKEVDQLASLNLMKRIGTSKHLLASQY